MSTPRIIGHARSALRHAGCGACLLVLPLAAFAQVGASGEYLARMDVDRDGRVAVVEYQDWLSYAFDAMDRNRDAVLSPGELPGGRGKPVTRLEHRARLAAAFQRQDRNHDGFLSARELAAPPQ
jgi:hypothetical protein